jgi:hypothetical protein
MDAVIDTADLQRAMQRIAHMPRAARFAAIKGLTRTAVDVAAAERHEIADSFDRPTPTTLNAIYTRAATSERPFAEVGVKDEFDVRGSRGQISWLRWQIYGGSRSLKAFERVLFGAGSSLRAVPGRFAPLDPYGNVSSGTIVRILSHLRADSYAGSTRALPRVLPTDTAKDARRKRKVINAAYRRAGGQYFALYSQRGKLSPGIYLSRSTAFGRTDPKPILHFVKGANYEPRRFEFHYTAELVISRKLVAHINRAVLEELAKQR